MNLRHLNARLLCFSYMNMAELRFLQERFVGSLAWFREVKDTFFALFMNGSQSVLVSKATPGFSATIKTFFKRYLMPAVAGVDVMHDQC